MGLYLLAFRLIALVTLVQFCSYRGRPFLCAGIWGILGFSLAYFFRTTLNMAILAGAIHVVLGGVYFFLLQYLGDGSKWWTVMIVGGVILFFVG